MKKILTSARLESLGKVYVTESLSVEKGLVSISSSATRKPFCRLRFDLATCGGYEELCFADNSNTFIS
ncbi:hypothetical protein SUGI_1175240 [Cryptomeria japonica]|nr:hypothetical protein SUGI_1175240 [Cryptomeria japonica]